MNMVMSNDWNSQQGSYKDLKSNVRSNRRTSDEEGHEFLELLKKTQSKVNSLENEFKNVEAENLHQDLGWKCHQKYFTLDFRILNKDKELEELIEASKNDVYFPVSCQEYADNGATQNGSYRVQPNTNISRKYIQHKTFIVGWT